MERLTLWIYGFKGSIAFKRLIFTPSSLPLTLSHINFSDRLKFLTLPWHFWCSGVRWRADGQMPINLILNKKNALMDMCPILCLIFDPFRACPLLTSNSKWQGFWKYAGHVWFVPKSLPFFHCYTTQTIEFPSLMMKLNSLSCMRERYTDAIYDILPAARSLTFTPLCNAMRFCPYISQRSAKG